ncbi:ATP-binding cassette domain-containing protein [Dactylosporangium sp. NPDC000555]|uniref:ATP-binding cassette domain-containing protein n=1 Tax=Dactylosporangium sp. NPDC000555 TaxID=3154260 RepID=UPI0033168263
MRNPAVWLPIAALLLAFLIVCYAQLIRRPARYLPKAVWALIILAQIPLGGVLYLIIGRSERTTTAEPPLAATPAVAATDPPRPVVTQPAAVRTHAITKLFPGNVGLHAVDLTVPARGVYGLVGPNGAGKTTLLSVLAGLRRPDTGQMSTTARVMLCPDTPAFEPWLTAAETVELFRRLSPNGTADTDHALALAGLTAVRDRRVGGFSRGMAQRLGLAVVLASGAQVLLLDEPTSALDPQGRSEILNLITALGRDHAVVFSSHILADVQRVADTVGVLREGRLIYQGPVDELLDRHTRPSWQLQLRAGADRLADRLGRLDWVAAVRRHEQGLRVDTTSVHAGETLLPAEISASGAELIAFNPVGADLETVFLNLVELQP